MPYYGHPRRVDTRLTPKQLKAKMDAKAKKISEKYRLIPK